MNGSTETTFYVLPSTLVLWWPWYRHALWAGLAADITGVCHYLGCIVAARLRCIFDSTLVSTKQPIVWDTNNSSMDGLFRMFGTIRAAIRVVCFILI